MSSSTSERQPSTAPKRKKNQPSSDSTSKRRKDQATSTEPAVDLGPKFDELWKKIEEELESAKTVINVHVDEIEEEVRNMRGEVKKLNLPQMVNDVRAFTQRMIVLECEIRKSLDETGLKRRLECIERKLSEISKAVKPTKTEQLEGRKRLEISSGNSGRRSEESEKTVRSQSRDADAEGRPNEDDIEKETRELQAEIAAHSKKLTKTKHELFSLKHRIEQTWKKIESDPDGVKRRIDEMKKEKHQLRKKEDELMKKIELLKDELRSRWEKGRMRHSSPQPGPSSQRRGGV
ncbi:hypothetical protein OSTOST_01531 [Ostertagia ostertagi]